jgi:hypothetical protein
MRENLQKIMVLIISMLGVHTGLSAQMFTVQEETGPVRVPDSFIRAGVSPSNFVYTGGETGVNSPTELQFTHPAAYVAFESAGLNVSFKLANQLVGLSNVRYMDIDLTLGNQLTFIRKRRFQAGIPVDLNTSFTNVDNDRVDEVFNQVNFAVGGGAFFKGRVGKRVSLSTEFTPGYGFSNSNGGFVGGTIFFLKGNARVNIARVFGNRGLSLGYDFDYRSFDIQDQSFDFDLTSHTLTIGVGL